MKNLDFGLEELEDRLPEANFYLLAALHCFPLGSYQRGLIGLLGDFLNTKSKEEIESFLYSQMQNLSCDKMVRWN